MRVVVAEAVDVVIFHEQHNGDAGVGEDLAVGVVERAARVGHRADLAVQGEVGGGLRDGGAVGTAAAARLALAVGALVPRWHRGVPRCGGFVRLFGQPE